MEIKLVVVIIMIALIVYNALTYKTVDSEIFGMNAPSIRPVILFLITMALFMFGLYLEEHPVYLGFK